MLARDPSAFIAASQPYAGDPASTPADSPGIPLLGIPWPLRQRRWLTLSATATSSSASSGAGGMATVYLARTSSASGKARSRCSTRNSAPC
jgi:hypothetical protein